MHTRNRPGEGGRLRAVILDAAGTILETTGSDDAVTLRAVAREAGITAPAIYAHFKDRDEIRSTVIAETFSRLAAVLRTAAADGLQPVERLRAVCAAYLEFARSQPHHYRLLFERHRIARGPDAGRPAADVRSIVGADAFAVLLDATAACVASGASSADDATAAAIRVWIGLHGQATLQASLPWFPWPPQQPLAEDLMQRLADLRS